MSKKNDAIFPEHSAHPPSELTYGDCPDCGASLHLKHVGKSTFISCTAYPACEYSKSLNSLEVSTLKVIENSYCPGCESPLAVKKGRYGMFIGCTNFPQCHYISANQQTQIQAQYTPVDCPDCQKGHLQKKQNRFGKFFYACDNYPKCKCLVNNEPVLKTCPQCNAKIMLVKSKDDKIFICADSDCAHRLDESKNEE
jgi:putative DNA topoisomerase